MMSARRRRRAWRVRGSGP